MKYIYSTSQISKLSLTLHTFSVTGSVASLFLTVQFLSLIINLNCAILVLFCLNFSLSENYNHTIHRLDTTLSVKAKVILST